MRWSAKPMWMATVRSTMRSLWRWWWQNEPCHVRRKLRRSTAAFFKCCCFGPCRLNCVDWASCSDRTWQNCIMDRYCWKIVDEDRYCIYWYCIASAIWVWFAEAMA
jgi:hypothetical protein